MARRLVCGGAHGRALLYCGWWCGSADLDLAGGAAAAGYVDAGGQGDAGVAAGVDGASGQVGDGDVGGGVGDEQAATGALDAEGAELDHLGGGGDVGVEGVGVDVVVCGRQARLRLVAGADEEGVGFAGGSAGLALDAEVAGLVQALLERVGAEDGGALCLGQGCAVIDEDAPELHGLAYVGLHLGGGGVGAGDSHDLVAVDVFLVADDVHDGHDAPFLDAVVVVG